MPSPFLIQQSLPGSGTIRTLLLRVLYPLPDEEGAGYNVDKCKKGKDSLGNRLLYKKQSFWKDYNTVNYKEAWIMFWFFLENGVLLIDLFTKCPMLNIHLKEVISIY